jgi:geranylgeranyl diphosphate synthase type 3
LLCRVDDIQDNSSLRRGIPTAHTVHGIASTINAAIYMFLIFLKKVQDVNHPEAMRLCTKELLKCFQGQGMEIYWRDNYKCPTIEEYQDMIKKSKYMVRTESRF